MSSAAEQEAVQEERVDDGVPMEHAVEAIPAPRAAPVLNGAPHTGPPPPVWPGAPMPLGARYRVGPDGVAGTNFALWAGVRRRSSCVCSTRRAWRRAPR